MKKGDIVQDGFWKGAEVIHVYTRAQALEDGFLVDVSELAREAGFTVPVAVTTRVWSLIEPTEKEQAAGQDQTGRLWDVLNMARLFARTAGGREVVWFSTIFVFRRPDFGNRRTVRFKLHSGPGDEGEHVLTIMMPEED